MVNPIKFFSRVSKHSVEWCTTSTKVHSALFLLLYGICAFFSCASDPYESGGLLSDVSKVNLNNIPNRSDLEILDIAFSSADGMYVHSGEQVFSVSKRTVKEIKPSFIEDSTPWIPRAISTDKSDKLYVAGRNHVWIFDASGESLGGFETNISYPTSIAVVGDGTVYIAGPKGKYVLHYYKKNGAELSVLEGYTHKELAVARSFSGGVVRSLKNGVVFGAKTPYDLIAYQDGQVVTRHQRPELDFEPKFDYQNLGKTYILKKYPTGKGIGATVTDEFVFYCYSLPGSETYIDVYDHNLNPVEIDVGIDGTLIGSDKEGYLYLKRKVDGREELFRAKFNPERLRKSS